MAGPIKKTSIKNFIKERTDLRVGDPAVAVLVELLTTAVGQIADIAKDLAVAEGRNTIKDRDLQAGFEAFLQERGPTLLSPDTIHTAIDGIENEAFTDLINLLRADLENRP